MSAALSTKANIGGSYFVFRFGVFNWRIEGRYHIAFRTKDMLAYRRGSFVPTRERYLLLLEHFCGIMRVYRQPTRDEAV